MRIRTLAPLFAVFAVACSGDTGEQAAASDEAQEYAAEAGDTAATDAGAALAAVAEGWETHYNMGHASMVADFHAPDGLFINASGQVLSGREAIAGYLGEEMSMGSPRVSIDTEGTIVEGDWGVAHGTYSVQATPEGAEPVSNHGDWAGLFHNTGGTWLIQGLMSNFDSPDQTPSGEPGPLPTPPADLQIPAGLGELQTAYETHFNLGHAGMVADLYTDDAVAMFSGQPEANGKAAIQQSLANRIAAGAGDLHLQSLGYRSLSDDMIAGHGTATISVGDQHMEGYYAALYQRGADGAWKIRLALSTAHPAAGM